MGKDHPRKLRLARKLLSSLYIFFNCMSSKEITYPAITKALTCSSGWDICVIEDYRSRSSGAVIAHEHNFITACMCIETHYRVEVRIFRVEVGRPRVEDGKLQLMSLLGHHRPAPAMTHVQYARLNMANV